MGEEIDKTHFSSANFEQFDIKLKQETALLADWFAKHRLDEEQLNCGIELEAWLINKDFSPAPVNDRFLALANNPLLSPELALFNLELNNIPAALRNGCLSAMHEELKSSWLNCIELARHMDIEFGLFGILPTLQPHDLTLEHISGYNRFTALNEQILLQRKGRPLKVDIAGHEHLRIEQQSVMLESAATSFQVHFQVPATYAPRYYNASLLASAATVAVSANSPFLFGKHLCAETRVPLFEQAVEVGGYADAAQGPLKRVSFGSNYLHTSALEVFEENLKHFPVLLPISLDEAPEELRHVHLHNGTIWRWNRPLVGFDANNRPHIRIEHRVMPAGPTLVDMLANAAFYYGLTHSLARQNNAPENDISFTTAKDNFYKAVRLGLDARVKWSNDKTLSIKKLILNTLLPMAREGLQDLKIDSQDLDYFLNIIEERTTNEQNGAAWQVAFVQRTGRDMRLLTETYLAQQYRNEPVHTWELPALPKKLKDPELQMLDELPDGFLQADARELYAMLKGPTLITLKGQQAEGIFISVLLHGNENSGLLAIQQLLRTYQNKPLPRTVFLFIGNVEAARYNLRLLSGQADYNRAWPGTTLEDCAETRLLANLYSFLEKQPLLLSIDLHNNTGLNPQYACVNRLDNRFLRLALLFSRTVVYFIRPRGVQSQALAKLCPAVTVECGKVGDRSGIERAEKFIGVCLNLKELSNDSISPTDIDLFHTVAQVKMQPRVKFSFDEDRADIHFSHELEYMNFRELTPGTPLGDCAQLEKPPFIVMNEQDKDVYENYFKIENGILRITRPIMPSMLTTDERVIQQDCFCYLMERINPPNVFDRFIQNLTKGEDE